MLTPFEDLHELLSFFFKIGADESNIQHVYSPIVPNFTCLFVGFLEEIHVDLFSQERHLVKRRFQTSLRKPSVNCRNFAN